ncbi:Transcription is negatively regulated by Sfu1p [Candida albicans P60002]|nr:Transcription is negatively regulated by Sfu1p [Candida albicans P76067]KHC52105.1 Transcription is negatively regulated by Sfu1p [Candida albicans P60002]
MFYYLETEVLATTYFIHKKEFTLMLFIVEIYCISRPIKSQIHPKSTKCLGLSIYGEPCCQKKICSDKVFKHSNPFPQK